MSVPTSDPFLDRTLVAKIPFLVSGASFVYVHVRQCPRTYRESQTFVDSDDGSVYVSTANAYDLLCWRGDVAVDHAQVHERVLRKGQVSILD